MKKFRIRFLPHNTEIEVKKGESLLQAALDAGIHINTSCGGLGTCGKCKVIIENGKVKTTSNNGKLTSDEIKMGYVLACTATVDKDTEVFIPHKSLIHEKIIENFEEIGLKLNKKHQFIDKLPIFEDTKVDPIVKKLYVEMSPPSIEDNLSDFERLKKELLHQHGISNLYTDIYILRELSSTLRESDWKVTATVLFEDNYKLNRLIKVEKGNLSTKNYGLAIDIGTTSIYVDLVDLNSGETIAQASEYNAQISCGEDVISRIIFSTKNGRLEKLQQLVVTTINNLIDKVVKKAGVQVSDIVHVVAAGNAAMTQIFLGIPPKYIREEPYVPAATSIPTVEAKDLDLNVSRGARVFTFPSRAGYVGGDITSGIIASGIFSSDKLTLYIDVGTNGEIVLGNSEWLVSCSCSAGPAFEGGSIKHGTRAIKGAIEGIDIDPQTLEPSIITIGNKKPVGICGSGLIDSLAETFLTGIINEKGKFNTDLKHPRIRKEKNQNEYVLVWANESATGNDISITESDIDNLIRTKAAIYAGITTLLDTVKIQLDEVDEVIIAGGFGYNLKLDEVTTIGLLPEVEKNKVKYIGNGSLAGCKLLLLHRSLSEEAKKVVQQMTYIDLSTSSTFMDNYVAALFLPHTDKDKFPSVAFRTGQKNKKDCEGKSFLVNRKENEIEFHNSCCW